jgi:ATP-dependent 26S proteasome regulatory subunit
MGKKTQPLKKKVATTTRIRKEKNMTALLDSLLGTLGKEQNNLLNLMLDPKKAPEVRAKMMLDVLHSNNQPVFQQALLSGLFHKISSDAPAAEVAQLKEQLQQTIADLENGPVRPGTFIGMVGNGLPGPKPKVHVITPDGNERFPLLHPGIKPDDLVPGMTVFLDPKGSIVLGVDPTLPTVGQEGNFLRCLDDGVVEASIRDERLMLYASQSVQDAAEAGELKKGDRLLLCPRRQFAFKAVPAETDRRHRFLDRSSVPDVIASRDIGKPHWVLGYMIMRARILLFRPDLLERFDLRPRFSVLMTGPTGCGKTLTIKAFLREFDRLVVERTGREDVGSRVIRVKVSELLSEWLGRSDKNIDELFDDVQSIACAPVQMANGEEILLPVVVILEEVEGMARRRGEQEAGVYDRIIGTWLQRLDDTTSDLGKLPLILITTSNRPDLIDSAMWRRLAGLRAIFRRRDREGLAAVLGKKLKPHYPYASRNGYSADQLRRKVIDQVVGFLFSPNGQDNGLVEITFRDGKKVVKHRRDFLTGSIVEQAVANAIDQTVFAAEEGSCPEVGLTAMGIIEALQRHIDGLADNLTAYNVNDYVDLPESVQVAALRRLRTPTGALANLIAED